MQFFHSFYFSPQNALVDCDYLLVRFEVGTAGTSGIRHPHPLSLAGFRLGSFHVRQDNHAVKVLTVDVLRRSVEAGSPAEHTLSSLALALLPDVDLAGIYLRVEGNHRELCQLGKAIQLSEES